MGSPSAALTATGTTAAATSSDRGASDDHAASRRRVCTRCLLRLDWDHGGTGGAASHDAADGVKRVTATVDWFAHGAPERRSGSRAAWCTPLDGRVGSVPGRTAWRSPASASRPSPRGRSFASRPGPGPASSTLRGRMLLPGFQDAHVHPSSAGSRDGRCDLSAVEDASAYRRRHLALCRRAPRGRQWIRGSGWQSSAFASGEPGTGLLDDVGRRPSRLPRVPRRPQRLGQFSVALELAGVDRDHARPTARPDRARTRRLAPWARSTSTPWPRRPPAPG